MTPFLSFYTPTYRRPMQLAACLASVQQQTLVQEIEQIVVVDHVGHGIDGMYQRIPLYAQAVHGDYVHVLCDDDVLEAPDVVERLKAFAVARNFPKVLIVRSLKSFDFPIGSPIPPVCGQIDLGCVITRRDVWQEFPQLYGSRYEGDFDHVKALYDLLGPSAFAYCSDFLFMRGAVSRGRPGVAA